LTVLRLGFIYDCQSLSVTLSVFILLYLLECTLGGIKVFCGGILYSHAGVCTLELNTCCVCFAAISK
jgi:hypothetical protein